MRTARVCLAASVVAIVLCLCATESWAIPVFARKYGFNCTMCHSNYPRLNDFGVRYRQNGYQLPGREDDEKTILESPPPFAMRTAAGYKFDEFDNTTDPDVNQFQLSFLDLLSGGLFARNIGYFVVYPPEMKGSRGVAAQTGTLEMANVVFSNVGSTWLNVRAGRFEPAYVPFSVKRLLMYSPYEIYEFAFPGNPDQTGFAFADTQTGIELAGYGTSGSGYAAGWIDGSGTNNESDGPSDFYVRGVKVIGRGEGQTTGQRIGLTGYFGKSRPALSLPAATRKGFSRFGVDGSFNFGRFNLGIQYLAGRDDKALWNTASDMDFSGGFGELNYMPTTNLVGFMRYDWVSTPASIDSDISRWTLGGRYYPVDNIALHLEYSHRRQGQMGLPSATETFFTTGVDFALSGRRMESQTPDRPGDPLLGDRSAEVCLPVATIMRAGGRAIA